MQVPGDHVRGLGRLMRGGEEEGVKLVDQSRKEGNQS